MAMVATMKTLRPYSKIVKEFDTPEQAREFIAGYSGMSLGMFVSVAYDSVEEVYSYFGGQYVLQYTTRR